MNTVVAAVPMVLDNRGVIFKVSLKDAEIVLDVGREVQRSIRRHANATSLRTHFLSTLACNKAAKQTQKKNCTSETCKQKKALKCGQNVMGCGT